MKRLLTLLLSSALLFGSAACAPEQEPEPEKMTLRVMTHNILYGYDASSVYGELRADERMEKELAFLAEQNCDIVFLNEVAKYQDEVLQEKADSLGYGFVRESDFADGVYTYNGVKVNHYANRFCNYVLYRKDMFTQIDTDSFSLSNKPADPHAPFSKMSSDALWKTEGRPRTAVWALLEHRETKARIIATCTHAQWITDDNGTNWNLEGLKVLSAQVEKTHEYYPDALVVFGGDLNGEDVSVFDSARYAGVNAEAAYKTFGQTALDHIFYSAQGTLLSANTAGDLTLSDHLALQAAIEFSV